ncbi:MAG: hypothetical protein HZB79_05655 [Deltaproteobacteria bacterium]|nr:hypothetical protein [Deltaproteobacteria bacterium]
MIPKFIESIEKVLSSTPIILSSNIQKHFGPDSKTVYVKGNVVFIDSSVLEIAIFAGEISSAVKTDKYRFHYMDKYGQMLFRYDNAPHYHEIPSFPHHKHTPDRIDESIMPSIKEVLNEISAIIIGK